MLTTYQRVPVFALYDGKLQRAGFYSKRGGGWLSERRRALQRAAVLAALAGSKLSLAESSLWGYWH